MTGVGSLGIFFVDKHSLGEACRFLRDGWHSTGLRLDSIGPDDGSNEVAEKLLKLPIANR